jgi:hypothetical protein
VIHGESLRIQSEDEAIGLSEARKAGGKVPRKSSRTRSTTARSRRKTSSKRKSSR